MTTTTKLLLSGLLTLGCTLPALAQPEVTSEAAPEIAADPAPEATPAETFADDALMEALPSLPLFNPFNSPFQQQNFVPDISLILDASAGGRSLDNAAYGTLPVPLSLHGQPDLHHAMNTRNGFNFNYAELTMSAPVDPYIDLFTTFHLSPYEFEIEEAYFNTRALPWNLQLKSGKFLSHFGRINPQHAHFWSFNDQPLINQAFFGNHGLNELSLRLNWLAPLDFYLDLGLELLQGENRASFGTQGFTSGDYSLAEVNGPTLWVATAKTSLDLDDNLVLLGGVSYAQGGLRFVADAEAGGDLHVHQVTAAEAFENLAGSSRILGLDLSLRWFIDSYRELSWQSEWLWRQLDGSHYHHGARDPFSLNQSGLYSQLIWRFDQQWRTGLRADLITQDSLNTLPGAPLPGRGSAMLEYNPTEFTRFRLQYNLDYSRQLGPDRPLLHEVFLQFNLAMGAHGAHEF
ncbi:MAG: hypothetical protein IGS03_13300 [Candidatus Sericytochromatia bacterium]|nr:hypothetical protein [Candidatus Sericytochromatia bacterium]